MSRPECPVRECVSPELCHDRCALCDDTDRKIERENERWRKRHPEQNSEVQS